MIYEQIMSYNGKPVPSISAQIKRAEDRINAKKEAIEDLQNEVELLKDQAFNLYKKNVAYQFAFPVDWIIDARDWLKMVKDNIDTDGNKLDKRKKYSQKESFNFCTQQVNRYCGIDDCVITGVIDFNFGSAYEIEFTSHGHKWTLHIPNINRIKQDYWEYYGGDVFKLKLNHRESDTWSTRIDTTFDEDELEDIMKKGIEEYCGGDK